MYVISLDNNEEKFENKICKRLEEAISFAVSLKKSEDTEFTVGILEDLTEFLDNFEDRFVEEFKSPLESFFMDSVLTATGLEEVDISYTDNKQADTFLRHFFRDYKDNLKVQPNFIIKDTFKLPFKNAHLINEISSFIFLQVPHTHTMACNIQLDSGLNVGGISYKVMDEVSCKKAAYDNAIYNLVKN